MPDSHSDDSPDRDVTDRHPTDRHPTDRHDPDGHDPDGHDFVLGPATRLLWRTHDTIHLELGSRAVVVEGLPQQVIGRVASSAPPRESPSPEPAVPASTADAGTDRVLATLADQGYLWQRSHEPDDPRTTVTAPRLAGELTALAARHGENAAELLSARRQASVVLFGHGRVTGQLGAVLATAGVGRVRCASGGSARLLHCSPGGLQPADEGHDLDAAANAAIARAAPEVNTDPLPLDERPDLTVLAVDGPVDEDRRAALHAEGAAHLVVTLGVDHGIVGPLVLPGLTSCLRCADLHRHDRDPAWSALAAQLAVPRRHASTCEVAIATIAVGAAAMQALAFLDGEDPACVDGTIEVRPPDWRLRRRSWPAHPGCDCAPGARNRGARPVPTG